MSEGLKLEKKEKDLPTGWDRVTIGEVCTFGGGKTPRKSNKDYWGGSIPWASPKDFDGVSLDETEDKLTEYGVSENSINLYESGTIAMVVRSGVLRHSLPVAQLSSEMAVNQDIKVLQPDTTKITSDYLLNILLYESDRIRASCAKTGTTVESIETAFLKAYKIPLPPLPEQRRIADILSIVDTEIQQTGELITRTEELKCGLIQDLLTGGIGHTSYKQTLLGPKEVEIPEEWTVKQMSDVAEIVSGGTPKKSTEEYWDGDIVWITPTDVTGTEEMYISSSEEKITQEGLENSSTTILEPGAVLMTSRATIGEAVINKVPATTNQGFKSLIPGERLYNEYLYYYVHSIADYLTEIGGGSTFSEINKTDTENIRVPIPPLDEQKKIAEIINQADKKRLEEREYKQKLQEFKRGLMQDLLTGKVRVSTDD